jgi:hypothetical protein
MNFPRAQELNSDISHAVLLMDDGSYRCRPVTSQFFVLQKGELHSASAKKVSGLERVGESKAAP